MEKTYKDIGMMVWGWVKGGNVHPGARLCTILIGSEDGTRVVLPDTVARKIVEEYEHHFDPVEPEPMEKPGASFAQVMVEDGCNVVINLDAEEFYFTGANVVIFNEMSSLTIYLDMESLEKMARYLKWALIQMEKENVEKAVSQILGENQ